MTMTTVRLFGIAVCLVAGALPAHGDVRARLLPRTIAICQTQNYELHECIRGLLGRYVDQPLCVDPDMDLSSPWGSRVAQSEVEQAQRDAKSYGFDGFACFPSCWRGYRWLDACSHSSVKGFGAFCVTQRLDPEQHFDEMAGAITNQNARIQGDKSLVLAYWNRTPAYWSKTGVEPPVMKKRMDEYRTRLGADFFIVTDTPEGGASRFRREYALTGDLCEDSRQYLRNLFRENLRVVDGLSIGETHMMNRFDREARIFVHEPGYLRLVFGLMRDILEEPEFKGRKLLGMVVVNGHENAYTRCYNVSHNGTRTLRGILDVALEVNPDVMKFGEWDEYNENTCFAPTLYNGYVTKRIVRSYLQKLRGEPWAPIPGDDLSRPNLAVSYRKSLSPGEPLPIEVLSIADGSWSGPIAVSAEVLDEKGRVLKSFEPRNVSADRTSDYRFVADTGAFWGARALTVRVHWNVPDGRSGVIDSGLHPIDFAPANSWNHKWVKMALRDMAPMEKCEVSLKDGVVSADIACASPIRYAMVCGGGEILYIHNPEDRIDRFREDATTAVFQVSFVSCRTKPAAERRFRLDLGDVPDAEWIMGRGVSKGSSYLPCWLSLATEPVYVRIPKDRVATAVMHASFNDIMEGDIPVKVAYEKGAYAIGAPGSSQVTLARLNRQASYPSVWNRKAASFSFRPEPDRKSMVYLVQVVTMDGREWRSEPLVWGNVSRTRTLEYDFSPVCGDVVRPKSGERSFFGMLGGLYSTATLRNRGPVTGGAHEKSNADWDPRPQREADPDAPGLWQLVFDGKDDLVGFPTELLPQNSPWEVSFEVRPDRLGGYLLGAMHEGTGSLLGVSPKEDGSMTVGYLGYYCPNEYAAVSVPKGSVRNGEWNSLLIRHTGKILEVVLDGKSYSVPALMPGMRPSSVVLGGSPELLSYFKGKIRKFAVRQK